MMELEPPPPGSAWRNVRTGHEATVLRSAKPAQRAWWQTGEVFCEASLETFYRYFEPR